ncbi:MAG TPA: hypothetical protein DIW53_00210 [Achromobacter sp.]|nr:hypothetical protein [Achromobacter sp.]
MNGRPITERGGLETRGTVALQRSAAGSYRPGRPGVEENGNTNRNGHGINWLQMPLLKHISLHAPNGAHHAPY